MLKHFCRTNCWALFSQYPGMIKWFPATWPNFAAKSEPTQFDKQVKIKRFGAELGPLFCNLVCSLHNYVWLHPTKRQNRGLLSRYQAFGCEQTLPPGKHNEIIFSKFCRVKFSDSSNNCSSFLVLIAVFDVGELACQTNTMAAIPYSTRHKSHRFVLRCCC